MGGLVFYSMMRKEPGAEKLGRGTLNSQIAGVMTPEEKQIIDTFNNPPSSPEHHSPPNNNEPGYSHHGTRCTLSSKLSGVTDPDEISRIIHEHGRRYDKATTKVHWR